MKTIQILTTCACLACSLPAVAKTKVMLFFDTEDYTCDRSNDAIRDIANLLSSEGVRGNFNIAGFLAARIVELGRSDVIEALKPHVIGTQTLYHSRHPNVAELGDDPRAAGEVGIETASFADWVRLAEDARTGRTTYEMPERHGKNVFATLPVLRLRPLRHPSQETRLKLYRDRRAVHLKVFCDERDPDFDRGSVEADRMDWPKQSVEIFIDTGDGAKRQIAVSPAGGVWDAKDGDLSWSSKAEVRTAFSGKKWEMEIALPFECLGGEPANGARWKMMVIRNAARGSGLASCGWPVAAHGDFGLAATLEFSHE